jgi:hypothetical protein
VLVSSGISVQENRVEIYAGDVSVLRAALEHAGEKLPDNVVIVEEESESPDITPDDD